MSEQEINLLRAEILQDYAEIAQYNCVLYSVIAALLAFAINSNNYFLCLLPYFVMFPIHFMCETRREGICRIGAYLNVFSDKNYQWERRLHSLDRKRWRLLIMGNNSISKLQDEGRLEVFKEDNNNDSIQSKIRKIVKRDTMYFQFYLISLLCTTAAIYKVTNYGYTLRGVVIRAIVIMLLALISIIIIRKTIIFVPDLRQEYIEEWKIIKREENYRQNELTSSNIDSMKCKKENVEYQTNLDF